MLPWLSQFIGGMLSHKYGTKVVVGLSTLIGSVMSSLIPPLAFSPILVMIVRAFQGFIGVRHEILSNHRSPKIQNFNNT